MSRFIHAFGDDLQWGISTDDGCLLFHPHASFNVDKTSPWCPQEFFEEVASHGGFEAMVDYLIEQERLGAQDHPTP